MCSSVATIFALRRDDLLDVGVVYDRAALIACPEELRRRYVEHLVETVPEGAPVCLITVEYDPNEIAGPPFSVLESEVRDLFAGFDDIEPLLAQDALARSKRFRERGLSWMTEKIYRLKPKAVHGKRTNSKLAPSAIPGARPIDVAVS